MTSKETPMRPRRRRQYVMAMVLGTALTALGTPTVQTCAAETGTREAVHDLSRYCTTCWKNARLPPDAWSDCTQEVLTRLLQRVAPAAWASLLREEGEDRREFLRAIDAVKKRTQRSKRWTLESPENLVDARAEARFAEAREEVDHAAAELLSPRQQQILRLSFDGWTVQEIADELTTTPARISDEKYKAIRKLQARLGDQRPAAS